MGNWVFVDHRFQTQKSSNLLIYKKLKKTLLLWIAQLDCLWNTYTWKYSNTQQMFELYETTHMSYHVVLGCEKYKQCFGQQYVHWIHRTSIELYGNLYLFIYLYIYIFIYLYIYLFIYIFIYLFIYLFIYIFIYLYIYLYIYIFIYLYIYLFIYIFIYYLYIYIYLFYHELFFKQVTKLQQTLSLFWHFWTTWMNTIIYSW